MIQAGCNRRSWGHSVNRRLARHVANPDLVAVWATVITVVGVTALVLTGPDVTSPERGGTGDARISVSLGPDSGAADDSGATLSAPSPAAPLSPSSAVSLARSSPPPHTPTECHRDAPTRLTGSVSDHGATMTRVFCNADVAIYLDAALGRLPSARIVWASSFLAEVWRHFRETYGSCAVPRDLPAPIGPNCERFGHPKPLIAFYHQNSFRRHRRAGAESSPGSAHDRRRQRRLEREQRQPARHHRARGLPHRRDLQPRRARFACVRRHLGRQQWAEICMYDFYVRSGRSADARRVFAEFSDNRDNLPQGASDVAWFRDWFHPLWPERRENGLHGPVLRPAVPALPDVRGASRPPSPLHTRHERRGFVHFMSGAVGRDLIPGRPPCSTPVSAGRVRRGPRRLPRHHV